jgi:hypothetical protein
MILKNDRKPTTASITAIQKTMTLGALSFMVGPPFMLKIIKLILVHGLLVLEILYNMLRNLRRKDTITISPIT